MKHINPKDLLHKVYTEQGGVKEYNKNQRAIGALLFAFTILIWQIIGHIGDKLENMPIKACEIQKDEEPPC